MPCLSSITYDMEEFKRLKHGLTKKNPSAKSPEVGKMDGVMFDKQEITTMEFGGLLHGSVVMV